MRPTPGTVYVSAIDPSLRLLVEDVIPDETEADGYYLVMLAPENDPTAIGIELDGWEWADSLNRFKLFAESPIEPQTT